MKDIGLIRIAGSVSLVMVTLLAAPGCEGYRCAEGEIRDMDTHEFIEDVKCTVITRGNFVVYSDSLGRFDVCNVFSGCVPDCPDITVEFSKLGYKTKRVTNPEYGALIYLVK